MARDTLIKYRQGTTAQWDAAQATLDPVPILESGEPGLDTTVGKYKVGDGIKLWGELPYQETSSGAFIKALVFGS